MSPPPDALPCPICAQAAVAPHRPFCSATCRNRDLIAWLDERYVVPGRPAGDEGDANAD